jgi:hypothetical protein
MPNKTNCILSARGKAHLPGTRQRRRLDLHLHTLPQIGPQLGHVIYKRLCAKVGNHLRPPKGTDSQKDAGVSCLGQKPLADALGAAPDRQTDSSRADGPLLQESTDAAAPTMAEQQAVPDRQNIRMVRERTSSSGVRKPMLG